MILKKIRSLWFVFSLLKVYKTYDNRKPWPTQGIKRKKILYAKWKTCGSMNLSYQYHDYKKISQRIIRVAEKYYYATIFKENRGSIVKSWKLIQNIMNNKKCNRINDEFHIDNCKTTHKTIIVENFNVFYVNIGPSLASKIPPDKCDSISYIRNGVHSANFLRPVNEEEVISILKNMKNSSAGPTLVKQTCNYFLVPLVHVCDMSLLHGIFQTNWNMVIPFPKEGISGILSTTGLYLLYLSFVRSLMD